MMVVVIWGSDDGIVMADFEVADDAVVMLKVVVMGKEGADGCCGGEEWGAWM